MALGDDLRNMTKELTDSANLLETMVDNFLEVDRVASNVVKTFGVGRDGIASIKKLVAETIPEINRLGGSFGDLDDLLEGIAESTNRQLTGNKQILTDLFAAQKALGEAGYALDVGQFQDIGIGLGIITNEIEDSMTYIRSVGLNASEVMKDVLNNTEKVNLYNFQDGVQGLTKMASQASMLRIDMSTAFNLAEKVMNPEGAIEFSAAMQRLGVTAGALVDPFALMDASINDPGKLQDSLVNVAKSLTMVDDKTGKITINPGSQRRMRELAEAAGMSAADFSKMAINAADLDRRLATIRFPRDFTSEDDKKFIANMAYLNEAGQYEVKIQYRDEGSNEVVTQTKLASAVTKEELEKTRKFQESQPKTVEEIARAQLTLTESFTSDLNALKNAVVGGVTGAVGTTKVTEGVRGGVGLFARESITAFGGQETINAQGERITEGGLSQQISKFVDNTIPDLIKGTTDLTTVLVDGIDNISNAIENANLKSLGKQIGDAYNNPNLGNTGLTSAIQRYELDVTIRDVNGNIINNPQFQEQLTARVEQLLRENQTRNPLGP